MIEQPCRPNEAALQSSATLPRWILAAGVGLFVAGFAWHGMWKVLPWERLALSLVLAGLSLAVAWPLHRFARWRWATALAVPWVFALVLFAGPLAVLAALALASAAAVLGLSWLPSTAPARLALAGTVGLALIAGLGGWLLTWPVHFAWSWWGLVLGLLAWRRKTLLTVVSASIDGWRAAVDPSPRWAGWAITLLGLASTACWLPTMQVDDLAYHLGLPTHLLMYGGYRPDPAHQVWSYAPWAGDALQGFAAVMAGADARGAVNALWLVLAAAAVWSACGSLGARTAERWAAVALFASMPPLVWMAAGMQTELPATAVLAALVALIVLPAADRTPVRRLLPGAILFGALFAIKGAHVVSALPLLAYASWRHRRGLPLRRLPLALGLVLLVGGSSYVQSWWHTGNPVLPLFNAVFQSPYFPVDGNYRDGRWFAGFGPALPWQLVFNTDRYVEAWDGGLGFSLLLLSGAGMMALLRRETRGLALALALAAFAPLIPMQYARYAYPGLLLLVLVQVPHGQALFGARLFGIAVLAACTINLAFQANASWLHHSAALKRVIKSGGNAAKVYPYYVPERVLLSQIPEGDHGLVLATNPSRAYIAELGGRGRGMLDHDPTLQAARTLAENDSSGGAWATLLRQHGIRWVLVTPASAGPALLAGVQRYAERVSVVGDAELWRARDGVTGQ